MNVHKKLSQFTNEKIIYVFLFILFLSAYLLRTYLLQQNLFFGPEQGIDFLTMKDIVVNHKLTLIGAKTDVTGIYHGPIYYYVSAIPFFISHGDPLFIAKFLIIINCLTVFFLYLLGKELFSKRVGIFSALFFVISFNAIVYSRWLSSHPLSFPIVVLYFYFLYRFIKGNKQSLVYSAIFLGLLCQTEFLNILFYFLIAFIIVLIYHNEFKKQNIFFLIFSLSLAIIIAVGSFIVFDIQHKSLIFNNILQLLKGKSGYHISFIQTIQTTLESIIKTFTASIFPFYSFLSVLTIIISFIFLIYEYRKGIKSSSILLTWFIVPIGLLILLHHQVLDQLFVSLIPLFCIMVAFIADKVWKKFSYISIGFIAIILMLNIIAWINSIPSNRNIFFQSTQPDLKFSDEKQVIDDIYKEANNMPFSFQAYTIPYWTQEGWRYLFWYYGKSHYGYLPVEEKAKTLFVIVQDDPSDKSFQNSWLNFTIPKWGNIISSKKFGILTLLTLKANI